MTVSLLVVLRFVRRKHEEVVDGVLVDPAKGDSRFGRCGLV